MVYCNYCRSETDVEIDDAKGISCCVQCGRVLEDIAFSADVTFQKDAAGESTVVGQFVNESGVARGIGRIHGGRVYAYQADSHERAQQRGRQDIAHLVDQLSVRPREETIESAHRLYKLALQRGFTRGRRTNQVAAACLYLVCRQDKKPFLLIDFSDALQVNVFTLGAVFLQLAKLLRLEEHPLFSKPVDPSLYIHRFADRMNFPNRQELEKVAATAMRLVASMKRDWIQTGRRPSGVCGAALYIAAHLHGYTKTKKEVVSVVHIGEHTLAKRLNEFSTTEAGSMNRLQFEERVDALASLEREALEAEAADEAPTKMLAACEHISHGDAHFKHGMCKVCYVEFVKDTGGTFDGANPPAFSRNRIAEAAAAGNPLSPSEVLRELLKLGMSRGEELGTGMDPSAFISADDFVAEASEALDGKDPASPALDYYGDAYIKIDYGMGSGDEDEDEEDDDVIEEMEMEGLMMDDEDDMLLGGFGGGGFGGASNIDSRGFYTAAATDTITSTMGSEYKEYEVVPGWENEIEDEESDGSDSAGELEPKKSARKKKVVSDEE